MPDVVIVGAGPAGLAAAWRADECGASVAIIDDNPAPGGQIWRGARQDLSPRIELHCGARVIDAPAPGVLTIERSDGSAELQYDALVLATGARERFLPFPGWTLPHVTGAGGLQALVKSGLPIAGKKVVVAGSGPLLLAVGNYLRKRGADVRLVAEQAGQPALVRFGLQYPAKLVEALRLRLALRYLTGTWPIGASPGTVLLTDGNDRWLERCDYLACGFGLVPNTELAQLLGCGLDPRTGACAADDFQQSSVPGIFCAGEVTGIGGLDLSLVEGEIAGYAAAGRPELAVPLFSKRAALREFAAALDRAFALRIELRSLAHDDTLVCRCEDVPFGRIGRYSGWRDAKLQTRCGMGACQGRVCGAAVEFLLGWKAESVRPPVFPARIGSLSEPRYPQP